MPRIHTVMFSSVADCFPQTAGINLVVNASRTSGVGPLGVVFDTVGTTSNQTSLPFHEIQYTWNFGDDDTALWSYGSHVGDGTFLAKKNRAMGPVAAHVYETAGTYTVTCTAYDGVSTTSSTQTITVSDADSVYSGANTICYSASGDFTGAPSGSTQTTSSDFDSILSSYTASTNKRILFRAGDTFTASAATTFGSSASGIYISKFGVGALPVVNTTGAIEGIIGINGASDTNISYLNINGGQSVGAVGQNIRIFTGTTSKVTVSNMTLGGASVPIGSDGSGMQGSEWVFYQNTINANGAPSAGYGIYGGSSKLAIIGNYITNPVLGVGSHIIRMTGTNKGVIANNYLGIPGTSEHQIKIQSDSAGTKYLCVYDNELAGAAPLSIYSTTQDVDNEHVEDCIFERNWHHSPDTVGQWAYAIDDGLRMTIRNNVVDGSTGSNTNGVLVVSKNGSNSPPTPIPDQVWVYNNTYYNSKAIPKDQTAIINVTSDPTNVVAKNNLMYIPNATGGAAPSCFIGTGAGSVTKATNTTDNPPNKSPVSDNPNFTNTSPFTPGNAKPTSGYTLAGGSFVPLWSDFFGVSEPTTRDIGAVVH